MIMARCQVKTGFMILRECGDFADDKCGICGNYVCLKHKRSHPQTKRVCCIDCYAKAIEEEQTRDKSNKGIVAQYTDDYWYGYRNHFYQDRDLGFLDNYNFFSDGEFRAFEPKNNTEDNDRLDNLENEGNVFDS